MSLEIHALSCTVDCTVSSGEGHLSAEPDSRGWGHNGGKTQFFEGDSCYILVYKSSNVKIIGSAHAGAASFNATGTAKGLNTKREGITFSSPIATSQKPLSGTVSNLKAELNNCSGMEYSVGDTVLRLKTWKATSDPNKVPPYAFVFIEYEPDADLWLFSGMQGISGIVESPVHGSIFALAQAHEPNFHSL